MRHTLSILVIRIAEAEGWTCIEKDGDELWGYEPGETKESQAGGAWLPAYDTIDDIRRAVLAQDSVFQCRFNELMDNIRITRGCWFHELTAADWCDCFCLVLDERKADT